MVFLVYIVRMTLIQQTTETGAEVRESELSFAELVNSGWVVISSLWTSDGELCLLQNRQEKCIALNKEAR